MTNVNEAVILFLHATQFQLFYCTWGMSVISFEITPLLLTERYREWEKLNFSTDFSQRSNKIHEKS